MAQEIRPIRFQEQVKRGFDRGRRYRRARAMFVKEFVGQYYTKQSGLTGDEPINLIFNTIRAIVPNLVMKNPINKLETKIVAQKMYGELLGLAINQVEQDIDLKEILRAWIVSALFGWGIVKVGLAASGEMLQFGDTKVDPGQVYVELVDLDDFVIDPICTSLRKATFMGSRIQLPRQIMLDTDGYDHDLVNNLPHARYTTDGNRVEDISKQGISTMEMNTLQDLVDVVELWVPEADALVTIPDPMQSTTDKYLRLADYNGPKEGPYVDLSFTPPVQNNPYPVAPVSIWYDIHRMANRIFKKVMDQADRQKDMLLYNPAQADEAEDIRTGSDGDAIACTNPKDIQVISYGGQNRNNEVMLQEMQVWYNYMSGNPDQASGNIPSVAKGKETATRSQILQSNAQISIEDARNILYDKAAKISEKVGWYLHTDPMINLPLTKRKTGGEQIQLWLTPEQRQGDFLNFTFKLVARSMSRLDPTIKSKRILEFATSVVPAMMASAMQTLQMGMPFNIQRALTDIANEMDILEEVQDWFEDPDFQRKMALIAQLGPQNAGKAGTNSIAGVQQNGGSPMARNVATPQQENNQYAQETAAEGQSANQGVY